MLSVNQSEWPFKSFYFNWLLALAFHSIFMVSVFFFSHLKRQLFEAIFVFFSLFCHVLFIPCFSWLCRIKFSDRNSFFVSLSLPIHLDVEISINVEVNISLSVATCVTSLCRSYNLGIFVLKCHRNGLIHQGFLNPGFTDQ